MPKKIYIRTFGCQMNERDSELIAGMLLGKGYELVERQEKADIILFNTCSVRQHAEDRVKGNLQKLISRKKAEPELRIGILGCMAERHGELLFKEFPHVDVIAGPSNIYDIPELLGQASDREKIVAIGNKKRSLQGPSPNYRSTPFSAFVNVMYGCDNFCSYCIVPHVRGREISRPKKDIVKEIETLADRGFKEVTLLGQNVNSYGSGRLQRINFPKLLEEVSEIKGIERIRFVTSHPKDAGKGLFRAMRDLDKVCEHIHLPLQSGSNKILDLMNRKYTIEEYRSKIDLVREMVPDVSVTADILVGFPSEGEEDHKATRKAMEEIGFNSAFIFKYSPRPPALSSRLVDDVPGEVKKKRNNELLDIQKRISHARNKEMTGSVQEVLVEGRSRMSDKELVGRTRNNTFCVFPGDTQNRHPGKDALAGQLVRVQVKGASPFTLKGEIIE